VPQGRELAAGVARVKTGVAPRPATAPRGLGRRSAALSRVLPTTVAWAALACFGLSAQADENSTQSVPAQYRLETLPTASARAASLPGVTSLGVGQEFLVGLPASFRFDSPAGMRLDDTSNPLERPRATYRYTWFSSPSWDFKIGLSTAVDQSTPWQRLIAPTTSDHMHVGALPSMHLASEGRLADRWLLSVSAEGVRTGHGQGLDMDFRVDYSLTRDVALFGSYRLTDSSGEGQEIYGFLPANSAQFGVRLRF